MCYIKRDACCMCMLDASVHAMQVGLGEEVTLRAENLFKDLTSK